MPASRSVSLTLVPIGRTQSRYFKCYGVLLTIWFALAAPLFLLFLGLVPSTKAKRRVRRAVTKSARSQDCTRQTSERGFSQAWISLGNLFLARKIRAFRSPLGMRSFSGNRKQ